MAKSVRAEGTVLEERRERRRLGRLAEAARCHPVGKQPAIFDQQHGPVKLVSSFKFSVSSYYKPRMDAKKL